MSNQKEMPSAWIAHVKKVYAQNKSKGWSYKKAMVEAKKSYKKGGSKIGKKGGALKKKRSIKR